MTTQEVLSALKKFGNEQTKKTFIKHGAPEPLFGVKVTDLKILQKKIRKNHALAIALFDTGNSDAMYLAGLIAEPDKMSKSELQKWAERASWYMISEYTVAWAASESPFALELAQAWVESKEEKIACSGWSTLSSYVALKEDHDLDIDLLKKYLKRIEKIIHETPNRVRYVMNNFVIALGCYVSEFTDAALKTAEKIGKVSVDMNGTACKVPFAPDYIKKVKAMGRLGKKRKTAAC